MTIARKRCLVALGASAGGLQALGKVLAGLPHDFPAPIVAVIHLDPDHRSHLATLLQRMTRLRVQVARSGQPLHPGSVYVASPDRHLEVHGAKLKLTRTPRVGFSRPSIDRLFSSVAKSYKEGALAVILSGSGSDGSVGIADVRANGGLVIAQDPKTAQFSAMPENAIRTGFVDRELPVNRIPAALIREVGAAKTDALPKQWPTVLSVLRERFGTDFSRYRSTTLRRRLQRRMKATGHSKLPAYLRFAQKKPPELQRLHDEFLIKVSSFFRDPKEWDLLSRKVVRPLAAQRGATEFRIWSAGCATGEEAYSLAIQFSEAIKGNRRHQFKVFATDLDDQALATARLGVYESNQVAGLSPGRLRRYFTPEGARWRVSKDLRKHVIFGKHDLLRDPPLASMDVILCRNVLIYFEPEQGRAAVRSLLHSLKPGGALFLGRSESRRVAEKGLEKISGSSRIFRRIASDDSMQLHSAPSSPLPASKDFRDELRRGRQAILDELAFRNLLLEAATVLLVGLDSARRVIYWNRAAETFFGKASADALAKPIADVVGLPFWDGLKRVMGDVETSGRAARIPRVPYRSSNREPRFVDLDCIPFKEKEGNDSGFLVVAVDTTERYVAEAIQNDLVARQRLAAQDARSANEALQSANEELETLNEELQSTSEEQQTLNEELESRNEELETVNEELQSLNEELSTLNEEVGVRVTEVERLNSYLRTMLDLSPRTLIGCDTHHQITFWNALATRQFRLSEKQAVGQDLFDLVPALDDPAVRKLMASQKATGMVKVAKATGHPQGLYIVVGVVRDAGGRRRGFLLRVSDGSGPEPELPILSGQQSKGHPANQLQV